MKLNININEDEELRAFIKQSILEQVKSISRDEANQYIQEAISHKLQSIDLWKIVSDTIQKNITAILLNTGIIHQWDKDWVKPSIAKYVEDKLPKNFVETYAREYVRKNLASKITNLVVSFASSDESDVEDERP